jgi:hydroxymethylpyrimidine pyrophosphatase-like HAD family hydrolase
MATIAIDFDGTLVKFAYPEIGEPLEGAFSTVRALQERGHTLILWTCRAGINLIKADEFCENRGVHFDYINQNPGVIHDSWRHVSSKVFSHFLIDDTALGTPLKNGSVDWHEMNKLLMNRGLL